MVKDILADIKEHDVQFSDRKNQRQVVFDTVWGSMFDSDDMNDLYLNIIIPSKYLYYLVYNDKDTFECLVSAPYNPVAQDFRIRFVLEVNSEYRQLDQSQTPIPVVLPAYSYALDKNTPKPIHASQLSVLNMSGCYKIYIQKCFNNIFNRAFIYSGEETDLLTGESDDQNAQFLALCGPGKYYRYPVLGVGLIDYLHSVVEHTDLADKLLNEFNDNLIPLRDAEYDQENGMLDTIFLPEKEDDEIYATIPADQLDMELLENADDNFIRHQSDSAISADDTDFIETLMEYAELFGLFFFPRDTTEKHKLSDRSEAGLIEPNGDVIESEDGLVVSANVRAGSIIAFNLPSYNYDTNPAFLFNDLGGEHTYITEVGRDFTIQPSFMKCAVVLQDCTVRYGISREDFRNPEYGIFLIPATIENYRSLLGIVIDGVTGRILSITIPGTYVSNSALDESLSSTAMEGETGRVLVTTD